MTGARPAFSCRLRLFGADTEEREDALLDVGPVDSDAARAQLPSVEDEVVGEGANGEGIRLQLLEVLGSQVRDQLGRHPLLVAWCIGNIRSMPMPPGAALTG